MDWLFVYGSLLPSGLPKLPERVVPCSLIGWQRMWGVAMDNSVDLPGYKYYLAADGRRPALMVAFLDITPVPDARTNGIAVPVEPSELPGLDARERNYERVAVTGEVDRALEGCVWAYRGSMAARERAARGDAEGRLVISRRYRDDVMAGFDLLGQRARFQATTAASPPVAELEVVYAAAPPSPRAVADLDDAKDGANAS